MTFARAGAPRLFRAIVFRRAAPTPDFTSSERVTLPGQHTAEAAWRAVHGAMRADVSLIGGEIEVCVSVFAKTGAERDAETLLN